VISLVIFSNIFYDFVRQITFPTLPTFDRILQSTVTTWIKGKYIGLELYLGQVFAVWKLPWAIVGVRVVHGQWQL